MPVSVLTLNLWHDNGPWEKRARRIGALVDALSPDLIGFQEVLRGPGMDLAAQALSGLGYELDFARASPFWRRGEEELSFGNAVASRWPIASREELCLPDAGDPETRSALRVRVDSPHGPIAFTSTVATTSTGSRPNRVRKDRAAAIWAARSLSS